MNTETMTAPKPSEIMTPELKTLVRNYLKATGNAIRERGRMQMIQTELLARMKPMVRDEFMNEGPLRIITDPKHSYLMSDEDFLEYDSKCQAINKAAGYNLPEGHCPALVAERIQIESERALVDMIAPKFGITADDLLCQGLDHYQEFVDLAVKMAVSYWPMIKG